MSKRRHYIVNHIAIGIDIGSTTVKAVVCNAENLEILWSDYQRHEARQSEKVMEFMVRIGEAFPTAEDIRIFCTGSGCGPLAQPLGARFIQEVNAVTLAVEKLHPQVNSVIEIGGQDAKIIMFRERLSEDGRIEKQSIVSMNDKCASGTGATIDKCIMKVGMSQEELSKLTFDPTRLHRVAAKCGVFAETDIVNLLKSGIPTPEIMNSLAEAIVQQNLSVLARGNTLRHKVLLLGCPNVYLPFLIQCWRMRIPESWEACGYAYPREVLIDELIFTPPNAQYYAAFGAVIFGLKDSANSKVEHYVGLDGLNNYISNLRSSRSSNNNADLLVKDQNGRKAFVNKYSVPPFRSATFQNGQTIRGVIGLDGGSTSSKAVLLDADSSEVLYKAYILSKGNPIEDTKQLLDDIKRYVDSHGATLECTGFGVTGYAADVLERSVKADINIVETIAHTTAALRYVPNADVICDIGGQDIKVLFLAENNFGTREIKDFRLSSQCSAGNGVLLQSMAEQFGIDFKDYAKLAFSAPTVPNFSCGCAVFLDADRVNFQKEGFSPPEMLAGLAQVLPKNIWQHVVQIPRLVEFGRVFVLQGGTQRNLAAVKAQLDYIRERVPDAEIIVHPHCGEAGAIGVAIEALHIVNRRGYSTFIGLDRAISLKYITRNDDTTTCHFCLNQCSRTFIDTKTPDGLTSRYVTGFSCEQGTVESKEALQKLRKERVNLRYRYPNLVAEEAELAFKHFFEPDPLPAAGAPKQHVKINRFPLINKVVRRTFDGKFHRSNAQLSEIKIGLPRVLAMYALGPFFRTYFETLGLPKGNVVWSPPTSDELWAEGNRYGSIDPCFPAKVIQAHIHELLFHAHTDKRYRRGPLNYIYFPCITHIPSWISHAVDTAACPIVAGSPNVIKAAFTKEIDFFARAGIQYIDNSISFAEPNLLKQQMFETWGPRFGITVDESDWAVEQGWLALKAFNQHMETRGKAIIEQVEQENRLAILMIGRPYHNDPGINHRVLDEFQSLGYPILSIRSIPKDPIWLQQYFGMADPLDINDVWPENYSANSAQKVWAARFAVRHPHIAILDLSSFKCGNDAPTYGIIDKLVRTVRMSYMALHDIDANKPSGSFKIRVKTYAHKLKLVEQELTDSKVAETTLPEESLQIDVNPPYTPPRLESKREQWTESLFNHFTADQRAHTTILLSGLTLAHDRLCCSALRGIGYNVEILDLPNNEALQRGKEFGNRSQCNPTYYTVGNLIKHLQCLRDQLGLTTQEIIDNYLFMTAGACGPCRFGTYVTEYRKALRDAGFEGFRVLLFQQQGGMKQATGNDLGLRIDRHFMFGLARAMILGDVINLLGYRMRPYELNKGSTDAMLEQATQSLATALENNRSILIALYRCRRLISHIQIDRTIPKPLVSIIGEFWSMTTEGDGNYRLQRFLEEEGAEVDIQAITHWLLFMVWENRFDTLQRIGLRYADSGRKGLKNTQPARKLWRLKIAEWLIRGIFQLYANTLGLHKYRLPDMDKIAALAAPYYDNNVRGGEAHMEVGKLIHFVEKRLNHMTISVKPFGCMPSSGVSDGVQSLIIKKWPEAIFIPIETTGEAAVNAYSRVQMMLFKARQRTSAEFQEALQKTGMDETTFRQRVQGSWRWRHPFLRPPHKKAGIATNLVYAVGQKT